MYFLYVVYHEVLLYLISQGIGYHLIKKGGKNEIIIGLHQDFIQ